MVDRAYMSFIDHTKYNILQQCGTMLKAKAYTTLELKISMGIPPWNKIHKPYSTKSIYHNTKRNRAHGPTELQVYAKTWATYKKIMSDCI